MNLTDALILAAAALLSTTVKAEDSEIKFTPFHTPCVGNTETRLKEFYSKGSKQRVEIMANGTRLATSGARVDDSEALLMAMACDAVVEARIAKVNGLVIKVYEFVAPHWHQFVMVVKNKVIRYKDINDGDSI